VGRLALSFWEELTVIDSKIIGVAIPISWVLASFLFFGIDLLVKWVARKRRDGRTFIPYRQISHMREIRW